MDVGLNNKNMLGEVNPAFSDVVFLIEATSSEAFFLWQEWSDSSMSNIKPLSDDFIAAIPDNLQPRIKELNKAVIESNGKRVSWEQIHSGFLLTIGEINELPISLCFTFALINGKKVCFYEATSRIVDHTMVEEWLISHFQLTHDGYTRWNHTNASNFHNCVNNLDKLDVEPRETIYKKR